MIVNWHTEKEERFLLEFQRHKALPKILGIVVFRKLLVAEALSHILCFFNCDKVLFKSSFQIISFADVKRSGKDLECVVEEILKNFLPGDIFCFIWLRS